MAYRPNLIGNHPFREGKIDRLSYEGRAEIVKEQEDFNTLVDCMVLCKFVCLPTIGPILWEELSKLYSIVTGADVKPNQLMATAERINNLIRAINIREGITKKDDTLPKRSTTEPIKGQTVEEDKLNKMLNQYYKLRGWNEEKESKLTIKLDL